MIRDDTTPEELDRWYRRTAEEIEEERGRKAHTGWSALRTPEHLARGPDTISDGGGSDSLLGDPNEDLVSSAGAGLDAYQRALLDTIAGHESPDYDVLYSPTRTLRRIKRGADGRPDYSRHPNDPARITSGPNAGRFSTAAGRYQFIAPTWASLQKAYPDLTDFSPANQDKAAWRLATQRYKRETGRDLAADLRDPAQYGPITGALRKEWTSLPGGIEQGQGQSEVARRMTEGVRRYQTRP